jgi:hypothetical protein
MSLPLSDGEFMSSDYSNLGTSSNVSKSDGSYLASLLQYHNGAFYNAYKPIWERVQGSTHLISNAKYEKILRIVRGCRGVKVWKKIYWCCLEKDVFWFIVFKGGYTVRYVNHPRRGTKIRQ